MTRRRAIIDRGRKRRVFTVDVRPEERERRAELEHTGGRERDALPGVDMFGHRSHGTAVGCFHLQRLPTADEQVQLRDEDA